MYKSLLSPEELNALLSAEQAAELAADTERSAGQTSSLQTEKYMQRIQQLESDMQQLLTRVNVLESQLKEYGAAGSGIAGAKEQADESSKLTKGQSVEETPVPAPAPEPITLSRVEKYKQLPKKSLFG